MNKKINSFGFLIIIIIAISKIFTKKKNNILISFIGRKESKRLVNKLDLEVNGKSLILNAIEIVQSLKKDGFDVIFPYLNIENLEYKNMAESMNIDTLNVNVSNNFDQDKNGYKEKLIALCNYTIMNNYQYLIIINTDQVVKKKLINDMIYGIYNYKPQIIKYANIYIDSIDPDKNATGDKVWENYQMEFGGYFGLHIDQVKKLKLVNQNNDKLSIVFNGLAYKDYPYVEPNKNIILSHGTPSPNTFYAANMNYKKDYDLLLEYH